MYVCVVVRVYMLVNTLSAQCKLIICRLAHPLHFFRFVSFSFSFSFSKITLPLFSFSFFPKLYAFRIYTSTDGGEQRYCKRKSIIFAISLIFVLFIVIYVFWCFSSFLFQIVCASSMRAKTKIQINLRKWKFDCRWKNYISEWNLPDHRCMRFVLVSCCIVYIRHTSM